jgi:NRPS condensation-like uncharacterized protein
LYTCCTLLKILAIASFAQERIFLDEQIRFSNNVSIYNELTVLRISTGSLSVERLQRAIRCVLSKHQVLRTSLFVNNDEGILMQRITETEQHFTIVATQMFEDDGELDSILRQINFSTHLFDISKGDVFHCEILRQRRTDKCNDNELITAGDIIIIAFHHAASDRDSVRIFFDDLCDAYNSDKPLLMNDDTLQYIDYASHERNMDMTISRDFWRSQLDGYNMENRLSLPVDRHRLSNDKRTGLASVIELTFDDNLSHSFLTYAASHRVTPFQLGLATFYAFLFKLTNGQNDLCIACINANRYRNELQNLIGMFVATLPYRLQLNPQHSFDQLVEQVRDRCLSILEHSHYPLQHILADSQHQEASPAFLETLFDFIILSSKSDRLTLNGAHLESVSLQGIDQVAKFDFMCTLLHNPSTENNTMSCSFVCSRDLFDQMTVERIARRFQHLLTQLFCSNTMMNQFDQVHQPIYKLSLLLPEEVAELEQTMFQRCLNIGNAGMV